MRPSAWRAVAGEVRGTLIAAGAVGLLGLGSAAIALHLERQAEERLAGARERLSHGLFEAGIKRNDLRIVNEQMQDWTELQRRRIVGVFERTVELDRFEAATLAADVPINGWSLAVSRPLADTGAAPFERHTPTREVLRFEAEPLHEDDVLALARALDERMGGTASLAACSIARPAIEAGRDAPRLQARCELHWTVFVPVPGAAAHRGERLGAGDAGGLVRPERPTTAPGPNAAYAVDQPTEIAQRPDDAIGRIFYTMAERALLEARTLDGEPAPSAQIAGTAGELRFDGLVRRSRGPTTGWVDGRAIGTRPTPTDERRLRLSGDRLRIDTEQGTVELRPGERLGSSPIAEDR